MNLTELRMPEYPLQADLYAPDGATNELPLLIYLHGAGERGTNIEHVYRHGIPKLIKEGRSIAAFVLCPQCPAEFVWHNLVRELKSLIDAVAAKWQIKSDRICITGGSMGGFGTWEMALTYPNFFSAAAPVCGGGTSWRCGKLASLPVKAYHGTADTVVPITYSELMVDAINASGGHAELVRLDGRDHEQGINEPYESGDLIDWILSKRRTNFERIKETCEEMF
ncbi:MAG: prolyl oligopeptidase family serine peptidase [Oscillospiraceae bacterium]|nr:prolyl oligopeptidase family serine peptidase [Oscillospiraceae bacterium]